MFQKLFQTNLTSKVIFNSENFVVVSRLFNS
nr:MAG TPA: hypothetical protein [Caudoviricetes sp.]